MTGYGRLWTIGVAVTALLVTGTAGAQAESAPGYRTPPQDRAPALVPGTLYTSTGVAFGGIIRMNLSSMNPINLTTNTFGTDTAGVGARYKSTDPSVSADGDIAFASNRGGAWRIYVMAGDGGGLRQVTREDAATPGDLHPVISPNGKRIAFISKRPAKPGQPESKSQDIWVVNIDGTGLRRVTRPQTDGRGDSYIRALAWSPDSNMLAFRGRRLVKDGETSTLREVLGFIQPNGAKESGIRIDDCGGGSVVDWVGDSVLYSRGGAVQGCFSTYYLVRTYSTGVTVEIPAPALGSASNGPGAARLSPRATHVVWTSYAPINQARLARIRIDGTGLSEVVTGSIAPGEWLWWRPGPRLTAPKSYRMETPSVTLRAGRGGQLEPVLRDRNRTVLSRSGQDWTWIDRMPGGTISTTGWLSTSSTTPPGTYRAQIVNAGFTATVTITVR